MANHFFDLAVMITNFNIYLCFIRNKPMLFQGTLFLNKNTDLATCHKNLCITNVIKSNTWNVCMVGVYNN